MAQQFAILPEEAQRTRLLQAPEVLIRRVGYEDRLAVEEALAEGQHTPLLLSLEAGETGEERK